MSLLLLLWGCTCQGPAQPGAAPTASHYGQFEALVDAAARGDVQTAQFVARSLQEGDVGEVAGEGGEEVGGALGFVQIAEDPEEVVDGVASAARGCAGCHAASGALRPASEAWSHQTAARRMAWSVAFGKPEAPPTDPEELAVVREAWDEADVDEELAAALMACARCHAAKD